MNATPEPIEYIQENMYWNEIRMFSEAITNGTAPPSQEKTAIIFNKLLMQSINLPQNGDIYRLNDLTKTDAEINGKS